MKKTLAALLALLTLLSLAQLTLSRGNLTAHLSGELDNGLFRAYGFAQNTTDSAIEAELYVVRFNKNGVLEEIRKTPLVIEAAMSHPIEIETSIEIDRSASESAAAYFWQKGSIEPLCSAFSDSSAVVESAEIAIDLANVTVTSEPESQNSKSNVFDGNPDTCWTCQASETNPQSMTVLLNQDYYIETASVRFNLGNVWRFRYSIAVSEDGVNFVSVVAPMYSSGASSDYTDHHLSAKDVRAVRILLYGRVNDTSSSSWMRLSGFKLTGKKMEDVREDETEVIRGIPEEGIIDIPADGIRATAQPEVENHVYNAFDDNPDTCWTFQSTQSSPQSVTVDLGAEYVISSGAVGFDFAGNALRRYIYSISYSTDGVNFYDVLTKNECNTQEYIAFDMFVEARFVRLTLYGRADSSASWCRVWGFKLYGARSLGAEETMRELFTSVSGRALTEQTSVKGWTAKAFDEQTFTDYTPSMGSELYAEISPSGPCSDAALYLYDNVGRETDAEKGAGGILAQRAIVTPEGNYTLSFVMQLSQTSPNPFFSGFTLSCGKLAGGNDTENECALQLRVKNVDGAKAEIGMLNSVQYNEGTLYSCFENTFTLGALWDVSIYVSPSARRCDVTISDSTTSETQIIYYSYSDSERVNNCAWNYSAIDNIAFNTGAGGKCSLYADDLRITYYDETPIETDLSQILMEQDFSSSSDADGIIAAAAPIVEAGTLTYTPSLGTSLSVSYSPMPSAAMLGTANNALCLTDSVGRTTDAQNGAGGLITYIDIPYSQDDNDYTVEFDMYAPVCDSYGGFSLASGRNSGPLDTQRPIAAQVRFSKQSDGMQFNYYPSIFFNDGTFSAASGVRLTIGQTWRVKMTIRPRACKIAFSIADASKVCAFELPYQSASSDASVTESWSEKKIDTLVLNTSVGGANSIYIDNITVTDTGGAATIAAANGIVRLEAVSGVGRYVRHDGSVGYVAARIDPDTSRFIERSGLLDEEGVSFEAMTMPGCFLISDGGELRLEKLQNTPAQRAKATFYKESAPNVGRGEGESVSYSWALDRNYYLCDTNGGRAYSYTNDSTAYLSGALTVQNNPSETNRVFYLRSETSNFVSDNFKGSTLNSQWHNNYPWKSANPTNASYNFSALITYRNIVMQQGTVLLKATKSSGWPKNASGETGIQYDKWGKSWERWKGYVGVISSKKVFYRQSYVEAKIKQPDSPIGYWNAFWLNAQSGWPPEIDVCEFLSQRYGHTSWHTAVHGAGDTNNLFGQTSKNSINLTDGFHTFALDWGYNYMHFYIDGLIMRSARDNSTVDYQNRGVQMILNTGIGGWEYEPDDTMVWDTGMEIDTVRSFRY